MLDDSFKEASALVAITPQLAATYRARGLGAATSLPLPYGEHPVDVEHVRDQVIYIGNVNRIYLDGLAAVISAIEEVQHVVGKRIVLRATVPEQQLRSVLGELPDFVVAGRIAARADLAAEIAGSCVAVCPISGNDQSGLSETSFPSKLLDYLAHARSILVFGPPNCSAATYFRRQGLDTVVTDPAGLTGTLTSLLSVPVDMRRQYRAVLTKMHGAESFRGEIMEKLQQISEMQRHV